jgi:protein-L-isoaspartate(D-aspartate) O-methyltransferase
LRRNDGKKMLAEKQTLTSDKIRLIMQLRRNGISDSRVLSAIEQVPREWFVTPQFQDRAYDDVALPIARDQTISQPTIVGLMTMELRLTGREMVLEIGTGSGYQAAILAKLSRRVHTIERHKELHIGAKAMFEQLKLRNITAHLGDGSQGWPHAAPYDRIMVTAAAFGDTPHALLEQLSPHGILIIPIDRGDGTQMLYRITREGETFVKTPLTAVRFVPLVED